MADWVTLGFVRRARGLRGEVVIEPLGSKPERFAPGLRVFLAPRGSDATREAVIESQWLHGDEVVVKFEGVSDRNGSEALKGMELRIPEEERPPAPEGEYYLSDLVGCRMEALDGRVIGEVTDWQDYGAAPLLEVKAGEKELLVPFTEAIYREVDIPGRRIVVELPEGLEDL